MLRRGRLFEERRIGTGKDDSNAAARENNHPLAAFRPWRQRWGGRRTAVMLLFGIPILFFLGRGVAIASKATRTHGAAKGDRDDWFPTTHCRNSSTNLCGRCPELLEAAKYFLQHHHQDQLRFYKVQMIQLVGQWPDDPAMNRVMNNVFQGNRHLIQRHFQNAPDPVAIVQPPQHISPSCRHQSFPASVSPAFWKMMAVHQHCTTPTTNSGSSPNGSQQSSYDNRLPDLVWFMDGDALLMDVTARIDFLWAYHQHILASTTNDTSLDMLTAHGRNGYNSGIFIVNCTSPTALRTLEIWHDAALDLWHWQRKRNGNSTVRFPFKYEQNGLHYMLNTYQWRRQGWRVWDDHYERDYAYWSNASMHRRSNSRAILLSSQALRHRIRHTTQCALQTFPYHALRKYSNLPNLHALVYSPGHFILHTAGVPAAKRCSILQQAMASRQSQPTNAEHISLTPWQAAQAYRQSHEFSYAFNETYLDWDYPP